MFKFLKPSDNFVGVDIGSDSVKLVKLKKGKDVPLIHQAGIKSVKGTLFSQSVLKNTDLASEVLQELVAEHQCSDAQFVTSIPAPCMFRNTIKVPRLEFDELRSHIEFEASNFIPQGAQSVHLDFHITGTAGENHYNALVVAVKNEIIEAYQECFSLAGLELAVIDVEHFAVQNSFEANYPDRENVTTALINVGARYSAISIIRDGSCLVTGEVNIGGKALTVEISESSGVSLEEAELKKVDPEYCSRADTKELLTQYNGKLCSEISRQLSYLWTASGAQGEIDKVYLSGGGSSTDGLIEAIKEETSTECELLNPFSGFDFENVALEESVKSNAPQYTCAVGLAIRTTGDKIMPEED